jgi:type IV secretion system protein VirB1
MPIGMRAEMLREDIAGQTKGRAVKRLACRAASNRSRTYDKALHLRYRITLRKTFPVAAITIVFALHTVRVATADAPLSHSDFLALAARCAPAVPVATLEAVARTESHLDPWVLHDNTTGRTEGAGSLGLAAVEAARWIAHGDSVDIGLMQISAANLRGLGMTVASALDPCASLAGGAAVLHAAYGGGNTEADQQAALLMALSRYNTGTPFKGIMNGYARTVLENAGKGRGASLVQFLPRQPSSFADPNAPPSWNVSETGAYAQIHGASWLVPLSPSINDQSARAGPARRNPAVGTVASK